MSVEPCMAFPKVFASMVDACLANGDLEKAEDIQKEWPLNRAMVPQHLCRALYSLTDVYWRTRKQQEAKQSYAQAKEAFSDVRPADRVITQRYLTLTGVRIHEETLQEPDFRWPSSLIDQLEVLEFSLQNNLLIELFDHHIPVKTLSLFHVFVVSGFVARSIGLHGYYRQFDPIVQRLSRYQHQMPRNMKSALQQLHKKNGLDWSLIAPY